LLPTDGFNQLSILFTDVEGSTRSWETAYEQMAASLALHDIIVRDVTAKYGGLVFSVAGDSFGIVFSQPLECLEAGLLIHNRLQTADWPGDFRIRVRQSMHCGVVIQRDGGAYGPEIVRAAILCELGHAGQILLSEQMHERLSAFPEHADNEPLGIYRLRKISEPQQVYQYGREQFAGLRTTHQRINTLPSTSKPLLGREDDVRNLLQLLQDQALVTLTGPGGIGKTSLAIATAQKHFEHIRDGVHFVKLSDVSQASDIPAALASAVELSLLPEQPALEQLLHYLKPRETLLLIDNCEHLLDDCAELIDQLLRHCDELTVLATSRESLELDQESLYRLPVLTTGTHATATELFLQCSKMRTSVMLDSRSNRQIIHEICRSVDGLPLAIELAAAQTRSMSLVQIRDLLAEHASALRGKQRRSARKTDDQSGARDPIRRTQNNLATVISWSVELLDDDEAQLFRQLAVFPASFTLESASEILAPGSIDTTADLLDSLVAKSLLETEAGGSGELRFRMLNTIRDVASQRLESDAELQQLKQRHCDHFLALAEQPKHPFIPNPTLGQRHNAEHVNLCQAAEWAITKEQPQIAARIANGCVINIDAIGDFERAIRWCRGIYGNTDETAFNALVTEAFLRGSEGNLQRESALAEQAIAVFEAQPDDKQTIFEMLPVAMCLSALYKMTTDPDAAEKRLQQAMAASAQTQNAALNMVFTSLHMSWLETLFERSDAVLERTKHFYGAMNTLTRVLARLHQNDIAAAQAEIVAGESASTDAWQHFHDLAVAQVCLAENNDLDALDILLQSVSADSGLRRWQDADYLIHFAQIRFARGDIERAEHILDISPSRHALVQGIALRVKQQINQWPANYNSDTSLQWLQQMYSQSQPEYRLAQQSALLGEEIAHWRNVLAQEGITHTATAR